MVTSTKSFRTKKAARRYYGMGKKSKDYKLVKRYVLVTK